MTPSCAASKEDVEEVSKNLPASKARLEGRERKRERIDRKKN